MAHLQLAQCLSYLLLLSVSFVSFERAESLTVYGNGGDYVKHKTSFDFYSSVDRGCSLCRNEANCSLAVHNHSAGVFCGDVLSTLQPCCCSFRNECMTTIFSNSCECFDGAREEEILTTRLYLFVALSFIAWGLLVYDKMCAGPYKVMNSSHQLLANSPSGARARTADSTVDTIDAEVVENQNAAPIANTVVVEIAEEIGEVDDGLAPLRPSPINEMIEITNAVVVEAERRSGGQSSAI